MAGQGSARVTLREIDQSLVRNPQLLPQGIPAAVVGTARKGPAFVPQTFANMQQFSETFGSMLERGEEGNSQRVGPLALNEWMRNAQAGTFLRVLGVGDGLKATLNEVTDAGFHVGHRLVQEQIDSLTGQLSDVGKIGNNPHAAINSGEEELAQDIGRTHFLGCFMEDSTGSSFLKDAGVQVLSSTGKIEIRVENNAQIANGTTLALKYNNNPGDATSTTTTTFTFDRTEGVEAVGAADTDIAAAFAPGIMLEDLKNAINGDTVATRDHLLATLIKDTNSSGVPVNTGATLVIESKHSNLSTVLNKMEATFNLRIQDTTTNASTDISVGGETSIVASQDFFFAIPGAQAAGFTIEATANPANDDKLEFSLLTNDGLGGLTDNVVEYTFKSTLAGNDGNVTSGAKLTDVYFVNTNNDVQVQIDSSDPKQTLRNLKAAIDRVAADVGDGTGQASDHEGKATTLLNVTGTSLTISQKVKGETGRSLADGDTASITKVPGGFTTLFASDKEQSASDSQTSTNAAPVTHFMFGGDSGESDNGQAETYVAPELTLALTDRPAVDDEIVFNVVDGDDITINTETFKVVDSLVSNGLIDVADSKIQVHRGDDIQEFMVNLKHALGEAANVHLDEDLEVVLNDDANSITFKQNARIVPAQNGGDNFQSKSLTKITLKMGNQAVFTNPDGDRLVGNSSAKTALFSGAGGGSAPVIRGILMTPQGVKATINPNSAINAGFHSASESPVLDKVSYGAVAFGTTQSSDLAGYVVGDVDSATQGFKLLLNGFKNPERPGVLDCSFDPASSTYFSKVLNTDPTKIEEFGHYLYAHWDVHADVAKPSNSGVLRSGAQLAGDYENMIGFCLPANPTATPARDFENFQSRFRTAQTPWIVSQFYSSADSSARPSTLSGGDSYKLFKLHSLDDGVYGNERFRLLIENVRYESAEKYGSFDVVLEKFDSNPIEGEALVRWKNVNLDPSSRNFVARVIGDQHVYYDFDKEQDKQRLVVKGEFEPKNKYVRVEIHPDVLSGVLPKDILPVGFQGHAYLNTTSDDSFIEPVTTGNDRIYFDGTSTTDVLELAKVLPLDYVQNISRSVGTTKEADSALAWGVKVGYREEARGSNSELTEQVFNKSLSSWTKFFPDIGSDPAWERDSETNETFQNSFFSLEKIEVSVTGSAPNDVIDDDWASAQYVRASAAPGSGKRFVNVSKDAKSANVKYLKFRCLFQGGFDGVNIFDDEKANLTSVAAVREGQDETGADKLTGPTILAYQRAIDVLTDKSATEFQLLAIPGQRSPIISDYAINSCEDRFDALYLMDIIEKDSNDVIIESSSQKPHVRNTIKDFSNRVLNTSFAASYFPDVSIRKSSDRSIIDVPPSVGMIGVMSQSDALADPWFAPAGLSRGRLINALDAKVQMNRDLLDELYDADINPLYVPAGRSGEVYAFGQKTLLQSESALDRINVRRLLIDIRRKVKAVGEQLLFEPNRASTLAKFSSLVEPIMANVQKRRGVTRYKVQIDTTTTTQNDIENNTIRGKVYLQPTKSVEFISLDFVVTNTID